MLQIKPKIASSPDDMKIAVNIGVDSSNVYYPSSEYPIFIRISFMHNDNKHIADNIKKELMLFKRAKKAGFIDVSYKDVYSFFGYFKKVKDLEKLLELLDDKDLYDRLNSTKSKRVKISQLISQAEKIYLNRAS